MNSKKDQSVIEDRDCGQPYCVPFEHGFRSREKSLEHMQAAGLSPGDILIQRNGSSDIYYVFILVNRSFIVSLE